MTPSQTIGFLHTALANEVTFGSLMAAQSTSVASIHRTNADLLTQAQANISDPVMLATLADEIHNLASQADVVVCTCSTLGALSEAMSTQATVFRVDRPMAQLAVQRSDRIDVVVAVESTVTPTLQLFNDESKRQQRSPIVEVKPLLEAWAAWSAGDVDLYTSMIAGHADELLTSTAAPDVVVLGQSSMLGALAKVSDPSRVLCSPILAIDEAIRVLTER
jgi:hypothetical protein